MRGEATRKLEDVEEGRKDEGREGMMSQERRRGVSRREGARPGLHLPWGWLLWLASG
jgi:hypothetical protein